MPYENYLNDFKKAAAEVDNTVLLEKGFDMETDIWLDSVVLRLLKKSWANQPFAKPQSGASIFFSVWLNDAAIKESKIFYNIHALKLRQLKGYSLTGRMFAASFREGFKKYEHQWPNVSTEFGPLTLMQGWQKVNLENFHRDITALANRFLEIDFLIDHLLDEHIAGRTA